MISNTMISNTMILLTGGDILDPSLSYKLIKEDLVVLGTTIKHRGVAGSFAKLEGITKIIDCTGKIIVPGLIDLHVHLREPGFEWKEDILSGTKAAIAGGFTHVCCMPNTKPVNDNVEITKFIVDKVAYCKVSPIGAVTLGSKGKDMAPLQDLQNAGCVAFSDDGFPVSDPEIMRRALEWCAYLNLPITCHEEELSLTKGGAMNESARSYRLGISGMPSVAEDIMIARDIELARLTGGKVHICHLTTARGVELIRRAKEDGIPITAEVTPHHLCLTEDIVDGLDTNYKMSPPLRTANDMEALRIGLVDGTIDVIASDHAPHDLDSKRVVFADASMGILGLQTTLPIILRLVKDNVVSLSRAIEALTIYPAKIFNLSGGNLQVNSLADITVIDLDYKWNLSVDNIFSKSKNTPFINENFIGKPFAVLVNGKVLVNNYLLEGI
jgi:dihydroorotase